MVEAGASEVHEEVMLQALKAGHQAMQPVIALQKQMQAEIGKPKQTDYPVIARRRERARRGSWSASAARWPIWWPSRTDKAEWYEATTALEEEIVGSFAEDETIDTDEVKVVFHEALKTETAAADPGPGRAGRWAQDRPRCAPSGARWASCPASHGSGLFTRGETQVLSIATLGTPREEQKLDTLRPEEVKRYMHHYNFPPFSTGETWPLRGPRRREIGHGALAETALRAVLPPESEFPYTLRVVSEVLSSNGSTSMASVCGSTLALMDAGVPIKSPVAGIAMGLIIEDGQYAILTDIQGLEDHLGDMDFKVAGTREGITALQMDIKIKGLSYEILSQALTQARVGRLHILDKMAEAITAAQAGDVALCAAHHHRPHRSGKDRQDHRPRRQDDPQDPGRVRRRDRHRGRRHRLYRGHRRPGGGKSRRDDRGPDRGARNRQDLRRQGGPHRELMAPLSRSCPASTAWCTSRNWPTIACPASKTWCTWATRSWSWSSTSTRPARSGSPARPCSKVGRPKKPARRTASRPVAAAVETTGAAVAGRAALGPATRIRRTGARQCAGASSLIRR